MRLRKDTACVLITAGWCENEEPAPLEWDESEQQPLPETERVTTPKFIKSSVDTKATTDIPRVSFATGC